MNKKRRYDLEYKKYQGTPEQKKRRAQRNKDRRAAEREGKVHKGDGRDVDHKSYDTSDHSKGNKQVISASKNRSKNKHRKGEKQKSWK